MTLNFKLCTSQMLKFECRSLGPKRTGIFTTFAAVVLVRSSDSTPASHLRTQHPQAKFRQHNQSRSSSQFCTSLFLESTEFAPRLVLVRMFPTVGKGLSLDLLPGLPVTLVVFPAPMNKLCNFFTPVPLSAPDNSSSCPDWPLIESRRSLLTLASLAFALGFWIRSSRRLGRFGLPRLPSCDSPSSHGRVHRTGNSYHQTSWFQASCPSLFPPTCLPWSWQGRQHPWVSLLPPCTFAHRNFSIVSLCFSGESTDEACTAR